MSNCRAYEVGLILYSGAQMSAVLGLTDLFELANRYARTTTLNTANGNTAQSDVVIRVSHWQPSAEGVIERCFDTGTQPTDIPDVLILPPCLGEPPDCDVGATYTGWLQQLHQAGTTLASICAGSFILAESGLLEGRKATTHWVYEEQFQRRFPQVKLDINQLIIDDGDVLTAGGAMAWTDLGLKLVDRFMGSAAMIHTARILLIDPPGREQRYYSVFSPKLMHGDAAILKLQHWLQQNEGKETELANMASVAGLHERTLQRRFQKATGMTLSDYCQRLRVGRAQELLRFSRQSVESIAWEVGYQDPGFFRKVFVRIVGLSPGEYRRRFGGTGPPGPV
ncbi:GlxA family transcriptional regulator [Oceanobacter kriegii]|uniref:GlxA family transcriptional regulator n=1 Tax=Oceanobacter kriegii TaxID=64972 RepID=UPI0004061A3A|nr:GlxA family transcriptional regulator [Oceanobacter kriegii]